MEYGVADPYVQHQDAPYAAVQPMDYGVADPYIQQPDVPYAAVTNPSFAPGTLPILQGSPPPGAICLGHNPSLHTIHTLIAQQKIS